MASVFQTKKKQKNKKENTEISVRFEAIELSVK